MGRSSVGALGVAVWVLGTARGPVPAARAADRPLSPPADTRVLERIEVTSDPEPAVRLLLSAPARFHAQTLAPAASAPHRIYVDLSGTRLGESAGTVIPGTAPLIRVRTGQFNRTTTRVVLDLSRASTFTLRDEGSTLTIALGEATPERATSEPVAPRPRVESAVPAPAPAPAPTPPPVAAPAPPPVLPSRSSSPSTSLPAHAVPASPPATVIPPRTPPPTVPARAPIPSFPPQPTVSGQPRAATPPSTTTTSLPRRTTTTSLPPRAPTPPPEPSSSEAPKPPSPPQVTASRFPIIVLDPGHGGHDPGAEGVGGVLEKDVVLEVAQRLAIRLLARLPVAVVMTRVDDSFLPVDQRIGMTDDAILFLSLHANASEYLNARGLELFYGGGAVRTASSTAVSPQARLLGRCLDRALRARIGPLRRNAEPAGFGVLTRNPAPSALVEIGYLTHPGDAARTQDGEYQELLADALVDGVAAYLRSSAPRL